MQTLLIITYDNKKRKEKKKEHMTLTNMVCDTLGHVKCVPVCVHCFCSFRDSLVDLFKYIFSVFKRHYMYFYTFFHLHVFSHIFLNNKTHVPNAPLIFST